MSAARNPARKASPTPVGCLLAVYVVEQVGTQEYEISRTAFLERCAATYGDEASADFEPHLRTIRP